VNNVFRDPLALLDLGMLDVGEQDFELQNIDFGRLYLHYVALPQPLLNFQVIQ